MPTSYEKLSTLLKELFQLDQADLDFGIYRIMNQKRDEISRFLDTELLPQVKAAFGQYLPADKQVFEEKIEQAKQAAIAAGFDPEQSPKVKELREQQAAYSVDTVGLENEVYSHLYNFFRRYYDEGDFISMRRYKEGVYAIPYEGEEVKLHWANADQYYIKTSENFKDYKFRLPSGRLAHFKIVDAETEKDNVKATEEKDRRFILAGEDPIQIDENDLILRFEYRADTEKRNQKILNMLAIETILPGAPEEWTADLKILAPTESNPKRSLLEKHLADYTARNTFDYFIHKDLSGFLRRELDFYIKNEVMRLDDIEGETAPRVEQYLSKIKALRLIAHKIIAFLTQIEDFQKKLWLKKKFVVETNYCFTLDRVTEELYPEICANDAQREEWVRLFAIDDIQADLLKPGYSVPLKVEFLKANPFLVLDTKFFDRTFIDSLLISVENFDKQTDGILINSDNFHAIQLFNKQYAGKIKYIYIDPPYNAKFSEILYKNTFKHSSWLSLMENRVSQAKSTLSRKGVLTIAIDENEHERLGSLLHELFPDYSKTCVTIIHNPGGIQGDNFSYCHEYAYFVFPNDGVYIGKIKRDEADITPLRDWGGEESKRETARNCFYPILVKEGTIIEFGEVSSPDYHPENSIIEKPDGVLWIYPIDGNGIERKWRFARQSVEGIWDELACELVNGVLEIRRNKSVYRYKTVWTDKKYNSNVYGSSLLNNILGRREIIFPKSLFNVSDCIYSITQKEPESIIFDFFAGSGTTGHAVIHINREYGGNRKYLLVEMGQYFETILRPRIQKVIYSKDWKDGKPVSREGSSHCFKYLRLESYEDALNNLILERTKEQQLALEANPEFRENYTLSYLLDIEIQGALLNIQSFAHPFDYKLNIASGVVGESKPTKIDLVETFNYLIGLTVETIQALRGFKVITGNTPSGERTLIIWRDLEEKSNKDLEEFFRKQDYNPRDMEFDLIYVNGDNNLENLRRPDETWKVRLIEEEFLRLMFTDPQEG